jgi:predicted dehydrogenase
MHHHSLSSASLPRRHFLRNGLALSAAAVLPTPAFAAPESASPTSKLRAAVIGDTGHGNYGHEHDLIFNGRADVEVVAVADPAPAGRAEAAQRCGARRQYADYREMLEREKPHLVSVAPRWTDQHHAMALAALRAGAHVYLEKPITQTLTEADELLAVADRGGLKVVVAHQMRLAPQLVRLREAVAGGWLGELLEIRAHGKQDARAGGEDLVVLGIHLFDLMRMFAGEAQWCSARVTTRGRDITLQDAHPATENIGLVAGDEVQAHFAFANGVNGFFTSRARNRAAAGHWGLELIGDKGRARILADIFPSVLVREADEAKREGQTIAWRPWKDDPTLPAPPQERSVTAANRRVTDDWLAAIRSNREPACSGRNGMRALEMAMAIFQAGLTGDRIALPLAQRGHALAPV